MKECMRKCFTIYLILAVLMTMMLACACTAWAAETPPPEMVVRNYTVTGNVGTITKGMSVNITVHLKYAGQNTESGDMQIDVSRLVDSFNGGNIDSWQVTSAADTPFTMDVVMTGLKYTGTGNSLKLMVGVKGSYTQITVPVTECKEYEEPVYEPVQPSEPDPIPAPKAILSRNEMPSSMKAKEERMITVYVKNVGNTTMSNPIISFTPSEALMLPGASSTLQMNSIAPGKTESVEILVRALDQVTSSNQYLDAELKFEYYNRVATVDGSSSGRITIPAKVTEEKKPEEEETVTDSPVPNLIITHFNYGGASVAAGSSFDLSFDFVNTSSNLAAENVVVTVEGGEGFTINGSTNTFYFEKVKAGGKKTVTVPMKVMQTVANGAQPVSVSFKYEYVDNKKRNASSADLKITVPVYQKDRFEISRPVVPVMVYAGEENSITMSYVNKGKSDILNVEAALEGNVDTYTPVQNIGNLEPGKSGTIAFSVTALEAGEAEFTITVTYEDANGDTKTREFPVTMAVEEMVYDDPGWEEPMPEPEPEQTGPSLPVILGIAAVVILAAYIIIRKRKKAAALKKEAAMWDNWDDDMTGGGSGASGGAATGTDGTSAGAGGTEEKK